MQIRNISLNKIRLDESQPRKTIDQRHVENVARSIKAQGIINPIEIDTDYKIITGEIRYRASVEAGMSTIPCKILIDVEGRFERQVIENLHHNTMTDWDTAVSLKKLMDSYKPAVNIHQFSKRIGRSHVWIGEKFDLLKASERFKESVRSGETRGTMLRAINSLSSENKDTLEEKIITGGVGTRDVAVKLAAMIKSNPENAKELLSLDLSGTTAESFIILDKVSRSVDDIETDNKLYFEDVERASDRLRKLLFHPPENISEEVSEQMDVFIRVKLAGIIPLIRSFVTGYNKYKDSRTLE